MEKIVAGGEGEEPMITCNITLTNMRVWPISAVNSVDLG